MVAFVADVEPVENGVPLGDELASQIARDPFIYQECGH